MEGVHLLPNHVKQLTQKWGAEKFRVIFIGSENIEQVLDVIKKNTNSNNWLSGSNEAVLHQVTEYVVAQSRYFKKLANDTQLPYFERTNNFEVDMKLVIELIEEMRELKLPRR